MASRRITLQPAGQAQRLQRGDALRSSPGARPDRGRSGDPGRAADRRRARVLRRPGSRRPGDGRRRRAARSRRHARAPLQPADPPPPRGSSGRWSAPSTASPPAPAPISRWPATSCWRRARRRSSRPFCRLGLVPDSGGTYILPRLVGPARAMGLALLGEPLPAEQAEAWGLIWRVRRRRPADGRGDRARPPSRDASRPAGSA